MKLIHRISLVLVLAIFSGGAARAAEPLSIYVAMDEEVTQKLIRTYEADTGQKVNFVRLSAGEATARILAEKGNPQTSLLLGGGAIAHAELKQKGLTTPYSSPFAASVPARFKDAQGYWSGIYLGALAFVYNPAQIKKAGLTVPHTWEELTTPAWKGHIQVANPGTSGTAYNLLTMQIKKSDEESAFKFLKRLHPSVSQYTRSGEAPVKAAALGETALAVGYAHDAQRMVAYSKAPLEFVVPTDGTGYEIAAVSLVNGGKQLNAAKTLIDWVYSKRARQVLADAYLAVIKSDDLNVQKTALKVSTLKLIDVDPEWAGKNKQRLIERWNDEINH